MVCRRIAEANALPSAKRVLLIVVPSILSADTRFPAASTTTTAMFKFWSRVNATTPPCAPARLDKPLRDALIDRGIPEMPVARFLMQLFSRSAHALTNFCANAGIVLRHFQN